ncbi:MAG: 4a-hydroxytetrahydrobiopterin dehydratase [Ignavibacterium sp.]|jgi:4a-hydroxytetrahydrobiopterin dehydratase|nr:4a-hydroxytetrahydrobiopterin dehydratase [Ignavibacterium sp.]
MKLNKLNQEQINSNLSKFSGWSFENNSIFKQFQFKDFIEALSFVNAVGLESEKMDHHPDILMFGWNKVKITISTHSAGGVTENDFELAQKIEERLK